MARIQLRRLPKSKQSIRSEQTITEPLEVKAFLSERGIHFDQWRLNQPLDESASEEQIFAAYNDYLQPFMQTNHYLSADLVHIHPELENYPEIRKKFLAEHTHSEDEVRFFAAGQGLFWFHLEDDSVFSVLCETGDLLSVPKHCRHWFDAGEHMPYVKAIRIFSDQSGWVPHYTGSGIDSDYLSQETGAIE